MSAALRVVALHMHLWDHAKTIAHQIESLPLVQKLLRQLPHMQATPCSSSTRMFDNRSVTLTTGALPSYTGATPNRTSVVKIGRYCTNLADPRGNALSHNLTYYKRSTRRRVNLSELAGKRSVREIGHPVRSKRHLKKIVFPGSRFDLTAKTRKRSKMTKMTKTSLLHTIFTFLFSVF